MEAGLVEGVRLDEGVPVLTETAVQEVAQAPVRAWVRWSPALATVIVQRVTAGESLMEVCREAGMPSRQAVKNWMRERPEFAMRMQQAALVCRRAARGGRRSGYHPAVAAYICQRIVEGSSLSWICQEDGMPAVTTVFNWLKRYPAFEEAYAKAREIQGQLKFDQVWDEAERATKATAYLASVRIAALRWQASRLAPKRYGLKADDQVHREEVDRRKAREARELAARRG